MVRGLEIFKEYFQDHINHFILIGGTACELNLADLGGFRATRDIDMLILLENMDRSFAECFHRFLLAGKYQCYLAKNHKKHFYRFLNPEDGNFPPQIELLSRSLLPRHKDLKYTPLSEDQYIRSMSAIILSDDYYEYGLSHRVFLEGLPCLDSEALIVFKVAAYLNLYRQKKLARDSVRRDDISKHRNDIFRLLGTLVIQSPVNVSESIRGSLKEFIEIFHEGNPEWRAITQSIGPLSATPDRYIENFLKFAGLDA